jgi:hypothetical protein
VNRGPRVATTRYKAEGYVACDAPGCRFPLRATRERTREHVAATGHTARYVITDTTVYRPLDGAS